MRRVKSEDHVADAKRCLTLGYVNMAEESVQSKLLEVAMFWNFGSMRNSATTGERSKMFVTGDRTVSFQSVCDHAKAVHVYIAAAAATDTEAQLIEAFRVSDRGKQRPHQRRRVASSDRI